MTQREKDMRAEKELSKFLDEHLYYELLKEKKFVSFERVTDRAMQRQGIDVIGKTSDAEAYIDEKAQLHYINQKLPTFAFELEFLWQGKAMEGWFLNDSLKTTHYLLLWPNATETDLALITSDDFTTVEGMMISKSKLRNHLDNIGLTDDLLHKITALLHQQGIGGPRTTAYEGIKFYMSPSTTYSEQPINIVVSKKILASLADAHYLISKRGFRRK